MWKRIKRETDREQKSVGGGGEEDEVETGKKLFE